MMMVMMMMMMMLFFGVEVPHARAAKTPLQSARFWRARGTLKFERSKKTKPKPLFLHCFLFYNVICSSSAKTTSIFKGSLQV